MQAMVLTQAGVAETRPFDFQYGGKSLLSLDSCAEQLKPTRGGGSVRFANQGSEEVLHLSGSPAQKAIFSISAPVEKGAEYLFRAKVKSTDQLVIRIGALSMSYNDLGNWQTVTGLYRVNDAIAAEIQLHLLSLSKAGGTESAGAEIKEISLIRVERPTIATRRSFSGNTDLVKKGAPNTTLVIPAGSELYAKLATQISDAVQAKTGVALPILSDAEVTTKDYPALKPEFHSKNLILLGRLGNNRAFWSAYNHFLTAVDGFYPGGNGYAINTAANVFRTGGNHLIIGGTTDEGVQRGTAKFLEKIAGVESERGNLQLPWLLEVDLRGECLAVLKKENAKWEESPESALLPKPEPGYGTVVRWYNNAMGYYWTGWDSYKKRADHYLAQVLSEKAYTHHYISEFFVRTVDMLDESGLITPEQIREIDSLFTKNFLDFMTVGDLSWMTTFAPPYSQIGLVNRHQIAPWMSDYKLAEFTTDILTPEGGMKELAEFRRQEKERTFINFVTHRSNPSLPGGLLDEVYEEVNATFFRFALEKELYREFFGSGNALKALALERIEPRSGRLAFPGGVRDSKLPLGIMASLTGDPELHWLWQHLPTSGNSRGYFQSRYLDNVRRYNPDASAPQAKPKSWSGIQFTPNPVDDAPLKADKQNYYFLSVRSGFEPDDDYLAFNGFSQSAPSGGLVTLLSNGVSWLGAGAEEGGRYNFNSASAIRTDKAESKAKFDDQSRCLWSADLPSGIALRFRQLLTGEIEWTRDFIQLGKGTFVFRDQFTAREEGTYLLGVNWHPAGGLSRTGNACSFVTRDGKLQIEMSGAGFAVIDSSAEGQASNGSSVRNQTLKRLAKGESAVSYTVVQASKSHAAKLKPVSFFGENRLAVGVNNDEAILDWNAANLTGMQCDAQLVIQTPQEAGFYDCGRLSADSQLPQRGSFSVSSSGAWSRPAGEEAPVPSSQNGEALFASLRTALQQPAPQTPQTAGVDLRVAVKESPKPWQTGWSYDGFLRPAKVSNFRTLEEGVIDFGKVIDLAEIRGRSTTNYYSQGKLPGEILLATVNHPNDPAAWKPASGKRVWRPGVRTANYGEAHPEKEVDETLMLDSFPARYVKTTPPTSFLPLLFFANTRKEARHPLRVESGDFLRNGEQQTLVVSDVFPQFPRPIRLDDLSVALLDGKGKAIYQKDLAGPVQSIRLLDRNGDGTRELFVLYANGTLEIYSLDGKLQASADLYEMHRKFSTTHDRKTRAPAGGYVLPFSVGLWRPNATGQRKIVVTRYGSFTFLNPDLSFEGVLNVSGYGTPGILPEGVDFGSGSQEQVVAERMRIWQLGGSGEPTVRDPNGAQFWPQTYNLLKSIPENEASRVPLGGMPIVRYELLSGVTQSPRYILIARGTSLGIYDAKEKKMRYNWLAQAPISGVGILAQSEGALQLLVATDDSLLWNFNWAAGIEREPTLSARTFPDPISFLKETGDDRRTVLIAGPKGIYLAGQNGEIEQITQGAFQTAAPLLTKGRKLNQVIAATKDGEVVSLRPPGK